ncbi:hypothetical protein [Mastigocoleus sp. MO_188.B34]|uniref:hypothetical protein n=1 Tax=Mastigocoleus sp. MO_188.B34 TaxID=3036635 RepID=UPI00260BEAC8|nr:hypothetical protein [Mastigocoleus sp. MO_188.B34]MDJ0696638.1 hypothetical protein [Mastigocoleus sp. MO_188.B34]
MLSAESIKDRFNALAPYLNEKVTRLWAGIEATTIGRRGITLVSEATGLSPKTIRAGIRELEQELDTPLKQTRNLSQIRKQGGGRKRLIEPEFGIRKRTGSKLRITSNQQPVLCSV